MNSRNKFKKCKGQWHSHKHLLKSSLSSMPINVTLKITLCTWEEQTQLKGSWLRGIGYFREKRDSKLVIHGQIQHLGNGNRW